MSACLDASVLVSSGVLWNASGHENVIVLVRKISIHSLKNIQPIVIIYVPQQFSPETDMVCQSEQLFRIHKGQFPFSYRPKCTITAPQSWQCFRVDASHSVIISVPSELWGMFNLLIKKWPVSAGYLSVCSSLWLEL